MRTDYFVRRALSALLVIVGVVTLTFFVARLVPSAPARLYAGARARPEQLAAIRSQLGLERPLVEQASKPSEVNASHSEGSSHHHSRARRSAACA